MKKILIYQDYVDHNNNAHNLVAIQNLRPNDNVRFCDADDILNGCLTEEINLFVIPGGEDLYICEKLNGSPTKIIREYVENGGTYMGLCGGAYVASNEIEWEKDKEDAICQNRELSLYNGLAIGPIYDFLEKNDTKHSWDQAIELTLPDSTTSTALYRAGPYFSEPNDNSTQVLARYSGVKDTPPAILLCKVKKGRAFLSGPHIERSPNMYKKMIYKHNNPSYEWQSNVLKKYNKGWNAENDLFKKILVDALDKQYNGRNNIHSTRPHV